MRSDAQFTPGPWVVHKGDVLGANNVMLGSDADLRLIAAAPDLYEALTSAMDELWEQAHGWEPSPGHSFCERCEAEGGSIKRDASWQDVPHEDHCVFAKPRAALAKACPTPATTAEDQS